MTYNPISKKRKDEDEFDDGDSGTFGFMTAPRTFTDEEFDNYVDDVNQKIRETSDMTQREKMQIQNHLMTLENLAQDRKETEDGKVTPEFKEKMFKIETLLQRGFDSSMQDDFRAIRASASEPTSDWWDTIKGKKKRKSTVNQAGNYTKPKMRKRLFQRIKAGSKGGPAGKWSARKAQRLALEYKKAGGGYRD
tara:strand:- start:1262 stop:1840 length:579 start_codon:yes stop_codon:yes gene_type:complete